MECYSEAVGSSGAGQDWNLERLMSVFNLGWKMSARASSQKP